jgi:hypothetical protein
MGAAGSGCSATDAEPTSELRLARGRERGAFLVANTDPFNIAVADSVSDRIKRVANEAEYLLNANLFEHVDQGMGYCLCHLDLLQLGSFRSFLLRCKSRRL